MSTRAKLLVLALVVLAVLFALRGSRVVQEQLLPDPQAAHVAIQLEGSDVAVVGRVEGSAGDGFTLHAVLEAGSSERPTYFTEAPALRIDGVDIPSEQLRPWPFPDKVRVLWFTVEGARPFWEMADAEQLGKFRLEEFLRADWPQAWSIPGRLDSARLRQLEGPVRDVDFGLQRYRVQVELFGRSQIRPEHRFRSAGPETVADLGERFPTIVLGSPGALRIASEFFGLTQVALASDGGADAAFLGTIRRLTTERLAYSRNTLLEQILTARGVRWEDLEWRPVDLLEGPAWSESGEGGNDLQPGDFLRVGSRVVLAYRDEDDDGTLGYGDLCLDFENGAAVRRLDEVFTGEGLVEWAG